uniref:Inhibin alpha chain n=1 Tax=Sinocyclocheilus grahami TaxID=75366 RepID=A0A672M4H7_SINGR
MFSLTSSLPSFACALMLWALLSPPMVQACQGDKLPRDMVLGWLKSRILDGLGMDEPPLPVLQLPTQQAVNKVVHHVASRMTREIRVERRHHQESSQVILFPSSESTCKDMPDNSSEAASGYFTYYFQPSLDSQDSIITSANFWFYAGEAIASSNISAPLFILTPYHELLQSLRFTTTSDGGYSFKGHPWLFRGGYFTYYFQPSLDSQDSIITSANFWFYAGEAIASSNISAPLFILTPYHELLQATVSPVKQIEISFEDLGWDNWIVHPKAFTFYYCHGNCSSAERTTTILGINQCCAPVPESMKSLRFTTTSDGGYSFKYETLPNIIPEECNCI